MRKLIFLCSILFFSSCSGEKARSGGIIFEDPVAYHDFIVDQQNVIMHHMVILTESYDQGNEEMIQESYLNLVNACDSCAFLIEELTPYEHDSSLQKASNELFKFYTRVFHHEYKEMLDIFLKGSMASDADITSLNRIVEEIRQEEEVLTKRMEQVQHSFASIHKFQSSDSSEEFEPSSN